MTSDSCLSNLSKTALSIQVRTLSIMLPNFFAIFRHWKLNKQFASKCWMGLIWPHVQNANANIIISIKNTVSHSLQMLLQMLFQFKFQIAYSSASSDMMAVSRTVYYWHTCFAGFPVY